MNEEPKEQKENEQFIDGLIKIVAIKEEYGDKDVFKKNLNNFLFSLQPTSEEKCIDPTQPLH